MKTTHIHGRSTWLLLIVCSDTHTTHCQVHDLIPTDLLVRARRMHGVELQRGHNKYKYTEYVKYRVRSVCVTSMFGVATSLHIVRSLCMTSIFGIETCLDIPIVPSLQ